MSKVVSLQEEKNKREPHTKGKARCFNCKYEWEADTPTSNMFCLECPECGLKKGEYIYSLIPEQEVWQCSCGNDLFHATKSGLFCKKCGITHGYDTL